MTRRDVLHVGLFWLVSTSCTRRDWVSDMLVLADVTGTWIGTIELTTLRSFRLTLRQNGAKVTGETAAAPASPLVGPVQGVVSGDVFTFTLPSGARGEMQVDGDEMIGKVIHSGSGFLASCPCPLRLRRVAAGGAPRGGESMRRAGWLLIGLLKCGPAKQEP
jgi:hypothetical protein